MNIYFYLLLAGLLGGLYPVGLMFLCEQPQMDPPIKHFVRRRLYPAVFISMAILSILTVASQV